MQTLTLDGETLAYVDEGRGPCLLFVHGTPVNSQEFAEAIAQSKDRFRCVAIDHLGFGASAKPADGDYSLTAHRRRLAALLDHLGLERFHLVVTDFGGPIALPLAAARWDRVESLTLMNTWGWLLEDAEPSLRRQRWLMTSRFMRWMYLRFNFSARVMIPSAWGKRKPLTPERHRMYLDRFPTPASRTGTAAFLTALFDRADSETWTIGERLAALPPKPTRILWGAADKFISTRNLERWQRIFPHAEVQVLDDVGHFVSEEAPEALSEALSAIPNS